MQRFQNNQFPEFESLAAEALSAGASLTFTLQHHHDWGQVHPVTITINRTSIRFEAGGLSEIPYQNNNAIHIGIVKDRNGNPDAPPSSCEVSSLSGDIQRIVSTEVSTNKNSEIFLNMKIREPHGQSIRNLNFADQFAAKEQWVKKAGMGVGVTKRTVRSRPEAMAALSAVQRAIQRAHSLSEGWAITDKKPAARTPITEPPPGNSFLNREVTKERSARALLGLVQDAMGGRERLAAIRDWQRKAKVTWAPQKGTTELMTIFVAPSSLKEESRGGNKTTEYSNGQAGWTWSSSKGITRELPSPTAAGMVLRTLNTLVLSDGNPSRAVNLLALDTVEVHDEFNNTAALTVDMKSHLPAKLSWRNLDGAMLEETYFDWREINGTMWWFRMTRARDGQTFLEERVRDYRINTGLTEPDLSVRP
jgi:hypothetical protein